MDTPTNPTEITQENEKKRSPWLIVILILLLLLACCCIVGAVFCRSSVRVPDILDRISEYVPNADLDEFQDFINEFEGFMDDDGYNVPITPGVPIDEIDPGDNICQGLSGNFEMQVLVGPSDAVGLDPFGIGSIPFTVEYSQGMYLVHGEGTIDYEDVLVEEWGTYTVFFDMVGEINGVCTQEDGSGFLTITLDVAGEQVFIVDSVGMHDEYPWEGEHSFDFVFPVVDGATESSEGEWAVILHLD